jgi:hypothetical protein
VANTNVFPELGADLVVGYDALGDVDIGLLGSFSPSVGVRVLLVLMMLLLLR